MIFFINVCILAEQKY